MDTRLEVLEKRVEELKKANVLLHDKIKKIELDWENLIHTKETTMIKPDESSVANKLQYLTAINEQMFQQNLRLRNFIEWCIDNQTLPSLTNYYDALRESE